jgi:beta-N-acetylhexosaminidase
MATAQPVAIHIHEVPSMRGREHDDIRRMIGAIRPRRRRLLWCTTLVALVVSVAQPSLGSSVRTGATTSAPAGAPSVADLIGQKLMVAMKGTTPSDGLLRRIKRGEIGGVILFSENITSARQLAALTGKLRAAAASGGQPPLMIATDQEGGAVKRVKWAPPTLTPPQMGTLGSASTAYAQGKATGIMLGCAGINHDLAPVADVPRSTSSFMYQEGRTWSFDASVTASLADAFASGLEAGDNLPTMKHFPGLGLVASTTDANVITVTASKTALAPGLRPYKKAISHQVPLIMLSNATYTAYDGTRAAGWSHAISIGLLRDTLGFEGVSITDSLNGTAAARGVSPTSLAIKAARAGTDMILLTGPESKSKEAYASLVLAAQDGTIRLSRLRASYDRILAMKAGMTEPPDDAEPPNVKAPASYLYSGPTLGSASTAVRTTWSAADPCGISRETLQRQTNGGAWIGQALSSLTSRSIRQSLSFGSTYRYRVKAVDGAGNTSRWAYGRTFKPMRTQESGSHVSYHGTWHTVAEPSASGGSLAYSSGKGASAKFTFTGYAVSWIAERCPDCGSAAVYVDGDYKGTVNLHSATQQARRVVYAKHWATQGTHVLRIVNLSTSGHPRVGVDAFVRLYAIKN